MSSFLSRFVLLLFVSMVDGKIFDKNTPEIWSKEQIESHMVFEDYIDKETILLKNYRNGKLTANEYRSQVCSSVEELQLNEVFHNRYDDQNHKVMDLSEKIHYEESIVILEHYQALCGGWVLAELNVDCNEACAAQSSFPCNELGNDQITSEGKMSFVATKLGVRCSTFNDDLNFYDLPGYQPENGVCEYDTTPESFCDAIFAKNQRFCCCSDTSSSERYKFDCPVHFFKK